MRTWACYSFLATDISRYAIISFAMSVAYCWAALPMADF
jgi:hypothetical protein